MLRPHGGLLVALLTALSTGLLLAAPARSAPEEPQDSVAMLIDLFRGEELAEFLTLEELWVIRATEGSKITGEPGLPLFAGDEFKAAENVRVKMKYYADGKEILAEFGANVVVVAPTVLQVLTGKIFAFLRGEFTVLDASGRALGVQGTELEVRAEADGTVELRVLDGVVTVKDELDAAAPEGEGAATTALALAADGGSVVAPVAAGEAGAAAPLTVIVENSCDKVRLFEVAPPRELGWVRFAESATRLRVEPGQRALLDLTLEMDTADVEAGVYDDVIETRCLDCKEGECGAEPVVATLVVEVREVQRVDALTRVVFRPSATTGAAEPMDEEEVREVLEWTDPLVIRSQPGYSVEGESPSFVDAEARNEAFREARFEATWSRSPKARAALGDIYADWGDGHRALTEYERATEEQPELESSVDVQLGRSRANRLIGRLSTSEELAKAVLGERPNSESARITLGNVYLDRAEVARARGDSAAARELAARSLQSYQAAREVSAAGAERYRRRTEAVALSNQGRARTLLAEVALDVDRPEEAEKLLAAAEENERAARDGYREYPFSVLGLGRIEQQRARLARLQGDDEKSLDLLNAAERLYKEALRDHDDLAPARYRMGTVWEERGPQFRGRAIEEYERAVSLRPTYAPVHFRLGVLKEEENPELARRHLQSYLALVPEAFRETPWAEEARTRIGARVPDLTGLTLEAATERLSPRGLELGAVSRRPGAETPGTVVDQKPRPGASAAAGARVDVTLAQPLGPVTLPDLIGLTPQVATERLEKLGLRVTVRLKERSGQREEEVVGQEPRAGRSREWGEVVVLEVAVPKAIEMPQLTGETRKDALRRLEKKGLRLGSILEEASCETGDQVIRQDPERKDRVQPGSAIDIVVGAPGPDAVAVPRLIGSSEVAAEETLVAAGFAMGNRDRKESEEAEGTILGQFPDPGNLHAPGCDVHVVIAKPIPPVRVPNFVGKTEGEVRQQLTGFRGKQLGLELGRVTERADRSAPGGTVIEQNPKPGTEVERETKVDLVVSTQLPVSVPDVYCLDRREAEEILRAAGFAVTFVNHPRHRTFNAVVGQSPGAGRRVSVGSRVTLTLGDLCSCRIC